MTSHYLRCTAKGSFEDIFQLLSMEFGNVYAKKFGTMGESSKGIVFGEQYFFRVSNDAALLITLEEISIGETRLEIIACAAGKGLRNHLWSPRNLRPQCGRLPQKSGLLRCIRKRDQLFRQKEYGTTKCLRTPIYVTPSISTF